MRWNAATRWWADTGRQGLAAMSKMVHGTCRWFNRIHSSCDCDWNDETAWRIAWLWRCDRHVVTTSQETKQKPKVTVRFEVPKYTKAIRTTAAKTSSLFQNYWLSCNHTSSDSFAIAVRRLSSSLHYFIMAVFSFFDAKKDAVKSFTRHGDGGGGHGRILQLWVLVTDPKIRLPRRKLVQVFLLDYTFLTTRKCSSIFNHCRHAKTANRYNGKSKLCRWCISMWNRPSGLFHIELLLEWGLAFIFKLMFPPSRLLSQ